MEAINSKLDVYCIHLYTFVYEVFFAFWKSVMVMDVSWSNLDLWWGISCWDVKGLADPESRHALACTENPESEGLCTKQHFLKILKETSNSK